MYKIVLSPYSRTFYNEWKLDPNRSDYNIVFDQEFEGRIDIVKLNYAIKQLITDYVICNSHINEENEELYWIKNNEVSELEYFKHKLTKLDILSYVQRPFDLEIGPLYRFGLIKYSNNKYRFIVVLHHIIIDGSSFDFFINELSNYYNDPHYKNNVLIQEQLVSLTKLSQKLLKTVESNKENSQLIWQEALSAISPLDLSFLRSSTNQKNVHLAQSELSVQKLAKIDQIRFSFDKSTILKLQKLKMLCNLTPYLYGQIIYAVLLHRYTGQDRFGICYAFSIKEGSDFIYGAHVNTNIIPYDFGKINNILDLIKQSKEFIKSLKQDDINHSYLPVSDIISVSNKDIIDIAFIQTNLKDKEFKFENTKICTNNHTDIDLLNEFFFEQELRNDEINYRIRYRLDKLDTDLVNEFADCYKRLFIEILNELVITQDSTQLLSIKNYNILSDKQYKQILYSWNKTDKVFLGNKTISGLFEEQVERTPDSIALIHKDESITYKELNERANLLAHYLQGLGVGANTLVLIAIDRSLYMIIGLLGILKAGGAYVPLDLSSPTLSFTHK